jgi:hypothetical protein
MLLSFLNAEDVGALGLFGDNKCPVSIYVRHSKCMSSLDVCIYVDDSLVNAPHLSYQNKTENKNMKICTNEFSRLYKRVHDSCCFVVVHKDVVKFLVFLAG